MCIQDPVLETTLIQVTGMMHLLEAAAAVAALGPAAGLLDVLFPATRDVTARDARLSSATI